MILLFLAILNSLGGCWLKSAGEDITRRTVVVGRTKSGPVPTHNDSSKGHITPTSVKGVLSAPPSERCIHTHTCIYTFKYKIDETWLWLKQIFKILKYECFTTYPHPFLYFTWDTCGRSVLGWMSRPTGQSWLPRTTCSLCPQEAQCHRSPDNLHWYFSQTKKYGV